MTEDLLRVQLAETREALGEIRRRGLEDAEFVYSAIERSILARISAAGQSDDAANRTPVQDVSSFYILD